MKRNAVFTGEARRHPDQISWEDSSFNGTGIQPKAGSGPSDELTMDPSDVRVSGKEEK